MAEQILTDAELADLRALAGIIVPPSNKYDVPGADDATIFADIAKSIGRDAEPVRATLARVRALAGGAFVALDAVRRTEIGTRLRAEGGRELGVFTRVVLLCYYRDDRVMLSLGLEPRAPFPKGHVLEQGDWSLLDPVRQRNPFWRPA